MPSITAPEHSPSSPPSHSAEPWQQAGFGLYVHWPFCESKCPYCDFNSHVTANVDQRRWARALVAEIARVGRETPGRVLNSVFFGGGTPSLMDPETVSEILRAARRTWTPANDLEVTLEANPSSVEAGRFRGYRDAGVNRASLGIQALNDADLRKLGRRHDAREALRALDVAMATFDRVSFDLIYARQGQSLSDWQDELGQALTFGPKHLSLYQLTIEDGTAFAERLRRGALRGLPSEDLSADLYAATQETCGAAGLPAYEVSNHSVTGAECRHNLIYWSSGDYAGVGPGAHGRLTLDGVRHATECAPAPAEWLVAVEARGSGDVVRSGLKRSEELQERLLMGLRLTQGMSLAPFGDVLPAARLEILCEEGLVERVDDRIRVTDRGRPLLNSILAYLV